jgi:maltose/moltooligosaccharide transporter
MEPFRAFIGDNLPDSQRTTGFYDTKFFIGIGAYFALNYLNFTHFKLPTPPQKVLSQIL